MPISHIFNTLNVCTICQSHAQIDAFLKLKNQFFISLYQFFLSVHFNHLGVILLSVPQDNIICVNIE